MTLPQWQTLMVHLHFEPNEVEYHRLHKNYREKQRAYHNVTHITDCLEKAAWLEETRQDYALQLAIWYHDVVYRPLRKDNEQKSAEQASAFLSRQSASEALKTKVYDLIMATLHQSPPATQAAAFLMDIDISILGAEADHYETYTQQIRQEYRWVPWPLYRKKRQEVLELFLARPQLYFTDFFRDKYEEKARENLRREVEILTT